jgi:hypothetical protein
MILLEKGGLGQAEDRAFASMRRPIDVIRLQSVPIIHG